ncbi:MAG: hypothetical protein AAB578_01975, partial [Elusimicrobiota bacterium]
MPEKPRDYEAELRALMDAMAESAAEASDEEILNEVREADAERTLGAGLAWPDLGVGIFYKREESANILLGGLTLLIVVIVWLGPR